MKCWRIDLQRKLIYYLHKELDSKSITKLENHLLDCNHCRSRLAHLRTSQAFAQQLKPAKRLSDSWNAIEAAIIKQPTQQPSSKITFTNFSLTPNLRAAIWFVGGVLLTSLLLTSFFWTVNNSSKEKENTSISTSEETEFSTENFRLVSINEMPNNTEPHVVTEGYVSETRIDPDGDTTFKLVEKLGTNQPFIICEIIDPIKISPPQVGSKVKVYGVSRYDEKINHKWYEVHPVLNIETVKH
jgi:hypothetical protein